MTPFCCTAPSSVVASLADWPRQTLPQSCSRDGEHQSARTALQALLSILYPEKTSGARFGRQDARKPPLPIGTILVSALIQPGASLALTAVPAKTVGNGAFSNRLQDMTSNASPPEARASDQALPAGEDRKLPRSKEIKKEKDGGNASLAPATSAPVPPGSESPTLQALASHNVAPESGLGNAKRCAGPGSGGTTEVGQVSDATVPVERGASFDPPATLASIEVLPAIPSSCGVADSLDPLLPMTGPRPQLTPVNADQRGAAEEVVPPKASLPSALPDSSQPGATPSADRSSPGPSQTGKTDASAFRAARGLMPRILMPQMMSGDFRKAGIEPPPSGPVPTLTAKMPSWSTTSGPAPNLEPFSNSSAGILASAEMTTMPIESTRTITVELTSPPVEAGAGTIPSVSAPYSKSGQPLRPRSEDESITAKPNSGSRPGEAGGGSNSAPPSIPAGSSGTAGNVPANVNLAVPGSPTPSLKPMDGNPTDGNAGPGFNSPVRRADPPPLPAPGVSGLQVARMVDGMAQSEMHIGLRTASFGSVEVHTVVRDSQIGLSVGSEKGDLRTFLAAEVSGLQTSFQQQNLKFDAIRFLSSGADVSSGFSGGSNSHFGAFSQRDYGAKTLGRFGDRPIDIPDRETSFSPWSGLNVRA